MTPHPLLERQIHKYLDPEAPALPPDFLAAVDRAYRHADDARQRVERSMHLMSKELNARLDEKLATEAALNQEKAEQAALIDRLEEPFTPVAAIGKNGLHRPARRRCRA